MAGISGSKVFVHAMAKSNDLSDDIISPLLSKEADETVATSVYSNSSITKTSKPTTEQTIAAALVGAVVAAGAAASIVAFVMAPEMIVYVAGGVCLFNCPIVLYNQKKMMVLPTLRNAVNDLRHTAELLDKAVEDTQIEIDDLKVVAMRFGGVEVELGEIAKKQNTNVQEIVRLVKENEETMNLMKENLRQRIIQDVIGAVCRTEGDGYHIDKVQAKLLALKIKVKLEVYGIFFDDDKFLQAIALKPNFRGAITVVKRLLPSEYQRDCKTYHRLDSQYSRFTEDLSLDEDDAYDMFYMSREEQMRRSSVLAVRAEFRAGRASHTTHGTAESGRSGALVQSALSSVGDVITEGGLFTLREESGE